MLNSEHCVCMRKHPILFLCAIFPAQQNHKRNTHLWELQNTGKTAHNKMSAVVSSVQSDNRNRNANAIGTVKSENKMKMQTSELLSPPKHPQNFFDFRFSPCFPSDLYATSINSSGNANFCLFLRFCASFRSYFLPLPFYPLSLWLHCSLPVLLYFYVFFWSCVRHQTTAEGGNGLEVAVVAARGLCSAITK